MIEPDVSLVQCITNAEYFIDAAYKTCYRSGHTTPQFITKCIQQGHLSPLEFANATFLVFCSRAASHQIVRHRLASYAQESQRRVKVSTDYILPESIRESEGTNYFMRDAYMLYEDLVNAGIPKEDARYVLPAGYITTLMLNMNFRELRHFFRLRCDSHAQWEIREIAKSMLVLIESEAPSVFGDLFEKYILEQEVELWTNSD